MTRPTWQRYPIYLAVSIFAWAIFIFFFINILIDPFQEYRVFQHKSYADSHTTGPFRALRQLEEKPHYLVFGTSHTAPINSEVLKGDVINLSLSVYGSPSDIYYFMANMNQKQKDNILGIYYLLAYNTFLEAPSKYKTIDFNSQTELFYQSIINIDSYKILRSLDKVLKNLTHASDTYITQKGEFIHVTPRAYRHRTYEKQVSFTMSDYQLAYLSKLDSFFRENQLDVKYFKTTLSDYFLSSADFPSVRRHFDGILKTIDGFYSFMWLEGISNQKAKYFRDPTHHGLDITRMQLEALNADSKRKDYLVTRDNVDSYLTKIQKAIKESAKKVTSSH